MALTLDFEPSERAKGPAICLAWGEAPGSDAFDRARAEGPTSCTKLAGLSALSTLVLPLLGLRPRLSNWSGSWHFVAPTDVKSVPLGVSHRCKKSRRKQGRRPTHHIVDFVAHFSSPQRTCAARRARMWFGHRAHRRAPSTTRNKWPTAYKAAFQSNAKSNAMAECVSAPTLMRSTSVSAID